MKGDMTKGEITPQLIKFTVPLVLGNFCQLTYNAADSVIVGRYLGTNALAAVGVVSPVMNINIFFIVGICLGMSILMSEFFGAGNYTKLRHEVTTSIIAGGLFTVALSLLGILAAEPLLRLLATPAVILKDSVLYLRIILSGLIFTFGYNVYASSLRSMGNAKLPLYFLAVSALLNILMDLFFILVLKMGIAGVALATVTAEALSALFCWVYVELKVPLLHFSRKDWVFDRTLLHTTASYSFVTAMQQITLHIGKLMVQGAVNTLGVASIAAFNAVMRMDDYVMTPQQNIGHANTTFIAQNRGAGKFRRIFKGYLIGVRLELIYTFIVSVLIFTLARQIMELFLGEGDEEAVQAGISYLHIMAFVYWMPAMTNIIQGLFRGMGRMTVTLKATFTQMVGRVIAAFPMAYWMGLQGVVLACMFGWVCMFSYELPIFFKQWKLIRKNALSVESD
jgi:putative MATE family efflux protein